MKRNVKAATTLVVAMYLVCFQLFLQSGSRGWLYTGNLLFSVSIAWFCIAKQVATSVIPMPALTGYGIRISFRAAMVALTGALLLTAFNYYLFPYTGGQVVNLVNGNNNSAGAAKAGTGFFLMLFTNSLPVNFVCGSLFAFFTAGIINERNYISASRHLSSVKL